MTGRRAAPPLRFPGVPRALDGREAVGAVEMMACRAAAPPAAAADRGAWTADEAVGRSLTGLRASVPTGGPAVAAMHDALFAAAGKRLTMVLGVASRAMTKQAVNTAAGHDDYHAVDDSGLFQLFACDAQAAADLTLIAHRVAELALNPGLVAQDALSTSETVTSVRVPEPELVAAYLGDPADWIDSPTPAQRLVYGDTRRRIPALFDVDYPAMLGAVAGPDSYAQGVAAQRPFFFDHVAELADRAMAEYAGLTGRAYARARAYRLDDAKVVLVGQGAIVKVCEAVCDHLRASTRVRVGVLDVTMFRPFPADLVSSFLAGRQAVTVLERVDQPLAVDPPLLREIRAAMAQAVENGRGRGAAHAGVRACRPVDVPEFHAGCIGLGSREVDPADVIAAVGNMLAGAKARRQFYLGVDFVRPNTRLPKLQVWQEQVADQYPQVADLAVSPGPAVSLVPAGSLSVKVHAMPAPGATPFGPWLARVVAESAEAAGSTCRYVQAIPDAGRGLSGRVSVTHVTFSPEPLRVSAAARPADVVLVADPRTSRVLDPAEDLAAGGALVVDAAGTPEYVWRSLPPGVREHLVRKGARLHVVDAARVVRETGDRPAPPFVRDAARLGAVLKVSAMASRASVTETELLAAVRANLAAGVDDAVAARASAAVQQGFDEVSTLPADAMAVDAAPASHLPAIPAALARTNVQDGIGHGGRFWERVGVLGRLGHAGLADPFAATGAIPAATSAIRDMTASRLTVPSFIAERCTGCGNCWVQCPDNAIPGVVSDVAEVLNAALAMVEADRSCDRLRQVVKPLAGETRRQIRSGSARRFVDVVSDAYATVAGKLGLDDERRQALDGEFASVRAALADFPLAKTEAFFDAHEARARGTGGLLSVTVNPEACKGCGTCVSVCPEGALVQVDQTDEVVATLRRNWDLWRHLPETDDRYVTVGDGGPLASLLLKQAIYQSVTSGDSAPPGAPEKTVMHLVLSAVDALLLPRVKRHVERLESLMAALDAKARALLASDARMEDVATLPTTPDGRVAVSLDASKHEQVRWLATLIRELKDLHWRYTEGPSGKGRASCGMAQAADVVALPASTYPFNPYPFPWVSHLTQDAPSVALGVFDGHMQKMARGFTWVRRAELEAAGEYDPAGHEPALASLDWRGFTDDEFALCPPVLAVGSQAAMADAGLQHLSHLLTSGRPIRVVVLHTAGDEDEGAQRPDLALLAIAHRQAFVLQASPAASSHLLSGVLRGLQSRGPSLFVVHCPRVPDDGRGQAASVRAAKLALESRAFPALVHDPARGRSLAEHLDLDGNPSLDQTWPTYELTFTGDEGEQAMTLPVTVADWAATETAFGACFTPAAESSTLMRFDEYLAADREARQGVTPFLYGLDAERRLIRLAVHERVVALADDRLDAWRQLRQMAGLDLPDAARARVTAEAETTYQRRVAALDAAHQARIAEMTATYPTRIARRLVEGLLRATGDGSETVADFLRRAASASVQPLPAVEGNGSGPAHAPDAAAGGAAASAWSPEPLSAPALSGAAAAAPVPLAEPAAQAAGGDEDDDDLAMEPYVQSPLCTSCDECITINKRMFAYNKQKQAYIKDAKAGTFRELVLAAEKCPVSIIHPGTPLNPDEKDLDKWVEQAARFR